MVSRSDHVYKLEKIKKTQAKPPAKSILMGIPQCKANITET